MTKLILIAIGSLAIAWLLCYSAMRTAEHIARAQLDKTETIFERD